jgi:cell division protease FtsH
MTPELGQVVYEKNSQNFLAGPGAAAGPSGYVERSYSEETAHEIDAAVKKIVDDAFRRTVNLLRGQRATLERGARQLLEQETLDEGELNALLREAEPVSG